MSSSLISREHSVAERVVRPFVSLPMHISRVSNASSTSISALPWSLIGGLECRRFILGKGESKRDNEVRVKKGKRRERWKTRVRGENIVCQDIIPHKQLNLQFFPPVTALCCDYHINPCNLDLRTHRNCMVWDFEVLELDA